MRCPPKENIAQRSVKSISRCVLLLSRGFVLHCPTEACWWRVLFSPRRPATCAFTSVIMDMQAWGTILRLLFLPWDHRVQHGRGSPPIFFLIFVGPYLKKTKRRQKTKQAPKPSKASLHGPRQKLRLRRHAREECRSEAICHGE